MSDFQRSVNFMLFWTASVPARRLLRAETLAVQKKMIAAGV
jgi:hypothetical protein